MCIYIYMCTCEIPGGGANCIPSTLLRHQKAIGDSKNRTRGQLGARERQREIEANDNCLLVADGKNVWVCVCRVGFCVRVARV